MKLILLMAITADGKIARSADHFPDWTGSADKRFFARRSRAAGVVIMGSKTFDSMGKPLPARHNIVLSRNPARTGKPPDLVFTSRPPEEILADLASEGYSEAILAGGSRINTLFARRGLIDEVILTVSPLIFGDGLSLFALGLDLRLSLLDVQRLDEDLVMLHYRVQR